MVSILMRNTSFVIILGAFAFSIMAGGDALAETVWYVDDNAPADFSTIQAALNAASDGDIIIVRDGTYTGDGNRDIDFNGKAVHLRSENGPENCIIDCQGTEAEPHCGFYFHSGEGENSVVDGFTITNGNAYSGGGMYFGNSSPTVTNNTITANRATSYTGGGGGMYCWNSSPAITGNTITDNTATSFCGGGIYCFNNSSPTITANTIATNTAEWDGGGIYCYSSSPTVTANIIAANTAAGGGGIYCDLASPTITANTIAANTATDGGAIYCNWYSSPIITNNTITATSYGGICCNYYSSPTLENSILWGNSASEGAEICLENSSTLTVRHSDIAGGAAAAYVEAGSTLDLDSTNINADPRFADPGHWDDNETPADTSDDVWINGDYHLKSEFGRWHPSANGGAGGWVFDAVSSPCIDGGDPTDDYSAEPMPNFARINMGAHGNTGEASRSGPWWNIPGDTNNDCVVNILDLLAVRNRLGDDPASDDNWKANLNGDGVINVLDLITVRNKLGGMCE